MARELSVEMFKKLQGQAVQSDEHLDQLIAGDGSAINAETMTVLDAGYELGNTVIRPVTLGVLPLLEVIESPFVGGLDPDDEVGLPDIMRALYVLACGREAVRPVAAIARRTQSVESTRDIAEKAPEFYDRYLAAMDRIADAWAEFDDGASAFWESLGDVPPLEALRVLRRAITDSIAGLDALPQGKEGEKKTDGSTVNGSAASSARPAGPAA